jgi:sugar phosphate permease
MDKVINIKTKKIQTQTPKKHKLQIWHVLLIGIFLGFVIGYICRYEATKNYHEFCTYADIPIKVSTINKI